MTSERIKHLSVAALTAIYGETVGIILSKGEDPTFLFIGPAMAIAVMATLSLIPTSVKKD